MLQNLQFEGPTRESRMLFSDFDIKRSVEKERKWLKLQTLHELYDDEQLTWLGVGSNASEKIESAKTMITDIYISLWRLAQAKVDVLKAYKLGSNWDLLTVNGVSQLFSEELLGGDASTTVVQRAIDFSMGSGILKFNEFGNMSVNPAVTELMDEVTAKDDQFEFTPIPIKL